MLDSESLNPVIISIALYIAMVKFLPQLLKNKTGVEFIDDFIVYLETQKGNMMNGSIMVGLIAYIVNTIDLDMF
jgi:3-hydroxy-3-methylglutaryl CoA synthase